MPVRTARDRPASARGMSVPRLGTAVPPEVARRSGRALPPTGPAPPCAGRGRPAPRPAGRAGRADAGSAGGSSRGSGAGRPAAPRPPCGAGFATARAERLDASASAPREGRGNSRSTGPAIARLLASRKCHEMRRGPCTVCMALVRSMSGDVLLSHTVSRAVPSALKGLASGFGMEPGVSLFAMVAVTLWRCRWCTSVRAKSSGRSFRVPDRISGTAQWTRRLPELAGRAAVCGQALGLLVHGQLHPLLGFHFRPINPMV